MSRECVMLGLPRLTPYYRLVPVCESMLEIMARFDALYLDDTCRGTGLCSITWPGKGSRSSLTMPGTACCAGLTCDLPENTDHGSVRSIRTVSLTGRSQRGHSRGSVLGDSHHFHSTAEILPIPGGIFGYPVQPCAQRESIQ